MIKVISAAALIAGMATASFAGNPTAQPVEQLQNDAFVAAPSSSSANSLIIPAVACLVICTLLLNDSSNGTADIVVAD